MDIDFSLLEEEIWNPECSVDDWRTSGIGDHPASIGDPLRGEISIKIFSNSKYIENLDL
jgi:hypothetical protein